MVAELAERGHALVADSSELGKALGQWRMELVADLGGKDAVSSQQGVILDLAVRTKLMLDSIDAWLLTRPSLVNKSKGILFPVVTQRQALADSLAKYMGMLGLERRTKLPMDLPSYLEKKYGDVNVNTNGGPHP
jgi:hypothetical protein